MFFFVQTQKWIETDDKQGGATAVDVNDKEE